MSTYFKAVKVPLKSVLKDPDINLPKLTDATVRTHKITIYVLQFLKLYLLSYYGKHKTLPTIDKTLVNSCIKMVCKESGTGRPPSEKVEKLKKQLTKVYKEHFEKFKVEDIEYTHLNTVLDYLTIDILTMYENNVKNHFVDYVERYVNVVWRKNFLIGKIRKLKKTKKERERAITHFCSQLRAIKNDLLSTETLKSKSFYHQWITEKKKLILPNRTKLEKNSVYYDLHCHPMEYLKGILFMMKEVENLGATVRNVFPLRSDIVPKHIRIDTTTLVHLMMTKKQGNKSEYLFKGDLKRKEDEIWKFFFRTELRCFNKPKYQFHHMIETDGVSCTVLLLRSDMVGKRIKSPKLPGKEEYIDDIKDFKPLKDKKVIGIDPGLNSLIYAVNDDSKNANQFNYSQAQRVKETKSKKYQMIIEELKQYKIGKKDIVHYESKISKYNQKTLNLKEFKKYLKTKNKMNSILFDFYEKEIFRKLKLNGYINRMKSEQKMMNKFEELMGKSSETVVCIGDYEQKHHMKFKEPTKGKGFRTTLRKFGYKVYLVDEYRTSCKCSKCKGGDCSKFLWRDRNGSQRLVHTLLRCKNGCGVWNRDNNGATNICRLGKEIIKGVGRPSYLSRPIKQCHTDDDSDDNGGVALPRRKCAETTQNLHATFGSTAHVSALWH